MRYERHAARLLVLPHPGCDGKGFGFDIFPLDPDYRDENGDEMWVHGDEGSVDGPDAESDVDDRSASADHTESTDEESLPF